MILPIQNSYWVEHGRLIASQYPGDLDKENARKKLRSLLEAGVTLFVGVALAALAASLLACMAAPRRSAALFAAVLACGLLCLGMRFADGRFGRFDPLPAWGERVRAACAQGCDGFVYGEEVTSLEFYSGFDWIPVLDPVRDIGSGWGTARRSWSRSRA
jgi:hypothetical protein